MKRERKINESMLLMGTFEIGLKEVPGPENNPDILQMFSEIGHTWVKEDETAWCSCFINWLALKCGAVRSGKLNARSWLKVGIITKMPKPGDVVIFWRESRESWKGHVGLFVGYTKSGDIYCLGGNQGNEVNISVYPITRLLGFRRLTKA